MPERTRWQYCQIEVSTNNTGVLKQFFTERRPVETDLHQNWPAMLAKLGEQGWEVVSVLPHEGGLGRRALTYVFKRPMSGTGQTATPPAPMPPPEPPEAPEPPEQQGPVTDFEPLRDS